MRPTARSMPNSVSFYEPSGFYSDESGAPQVSAYLPVAGYIDLPASVQEADHSLVYLFGGRLTANSMSIFLRGRYEIPPSWIVKDEQGYWYAIEGSSDQAGRGVVTIIGAERVSSERSDQPPA